MKQIISKKITKWVNLCLVVIAGFTLVSMSTNSNAIEVNSEESIYDSQTDVTNQVYEEVEITPEPNVYQYGKASYYAGYFIGRKTANGEIFTKHEYTCAHKTLPFGTKLKITNLKTNESIIVKVNDRGPFVKHRVVDLSLQGAKDLSMLQPGVIDVSVEIVHEDSEVGKIEDFNAFYVDDKFLYSKEDNISSSSNDELEASIDEETENATKYDDFDYTNAKVYNGNVIKTIE